MIQRGKAQAQKAGPDGIVRSPAAEARININIVSLFGTELGKQVLAYLRSITIEQVGGPHITNDVLRHLEGQRFIVGIIEQRTRLGHTAKALGVKNVSAGPSEE